MVETTRMEFITTEVYHRILNQELFDKISKVNFLDGKYEEIPLVSRYENLHFLNTYFEKSEISLYLAMVAQTILRDSKVFFCKTFKQAKEGKVFGCLTFVDFDEEVDDVGFCIPNLFFSTPSTIEYLNRVPESTKVDCRFYTTYAPILKNQGTKIYKTTTRQGGVNTERIYIIFPKELLL